MINGLFPPLPGERSEKQENESIVADINKIQRFVEEFARVEAETANLKRVPELDPYDRSVEKLNSFYIPGLRNMMGYMVIDELGSAIIYKKLRANRPPIRENSLKSADMPV